MLDVSPEALTCIRAILERYVPDAEVLAFGSRVTGTASPWSDLDIAILSEGPLDYALLAEMRDAFSESDLPYRVDVLDWSSLSEEFRLLIRNQYYQLQQPKNRNK
ncbi:MAG TPA: nucleotidyltransferase domain-containing protein [Dissulfurispiraceae bacterium]|nr:nucleotidyltransferase domain-containing protein [Dissulfurispiraceae bacterium]